VGANVGFYALTATAVDPDVDVHAFEPYPPVLELLRANLALNPRADRVQIFEQAIGSEPGHALLHIPRDPHGYVETSASLNPDFRLGGTEGALTVEVTTLDEHLATTAHRRRVSVVKVDVESLEHEVLAGASKLLSGDRPSVFVEVLPVSAIDALEQVRAEGQFVDVRLRPTEAVVSAAVEYDEQAWNHLWVPAERLAAELDLVGSCGLEVQR
jgi:FkbM family methyltransferase